MRKRRRVAMSKGCARVGTGQFHRSVPTPARPIEGIEHCVWLYFRISLSYRNVEERMASEAST